MVALMYYCIEETGVVLLCTVTSRTCNDWLVAYVYKYGSSREWDPEAILGICLTS